MNFSDVRIAFPSGLIRSYLDFLLSFDYPLRVLRGVLFIVRAGSGIIKTDFMHTKRTNFPTKMKIGIHLEELK